MSTPAEIRAQAAQLLMAVSEQGKSLDALLENRSGAPQERGLLRSLSYGVVRWYWRMYEVLALLSSQPPRELQPEVRALALLGLYQLLHTDIAEHAAVSETVEAARVLNVPRAAGLLNAIFRRCQRESEALQRKVDTDVSARMAHPRWLVQQLQSDWWVDAGHIMAANNEHPPFWLRVNASKLSREQYLQELDKVGLSAEISPYLPEALVLPEAVEVSALPGFAEGWISVQDAAAQFAAHFLGAQAGERVLDACAAPGGKTCHILELQPQAQLTALDISNGRMRRVASNLQRLGLNATLKTGDANELEGWWDGQPFDRILLDAPCSATGVIRRHPDIKLLRRANDINRLAARQLQMLERLWTVLKPGGRLVYATCSALKAENAQVIGEFLDHHREATDITAPLSVAMADKGCEVITTTQKTGLPIQAGQGGMDGFYYACLRKG